MSRRLLSSVVLFGAAVLLSAWLALVPSRAADDEKSDINNQLTELLKARCETLKQRLEYVTALEAQDPNHFHDRILANDEFLQAKLALATSRDERITIAKERVNNLREREEFFATRVKSGVASMGIELATRAARQQAEIDFVREQLSAK